jgi:hypothetical protein
VRVDAKCQRRVGVTQLICNPTDVSISVQCEGCPRVPCAVKYKRANPQKP